jgi:hypothetical protein
MLKAQARRIRTRRQGDSGADVVIRRLELAIACRFAIYGGFLRLARRTGRFPQLVDPRSRVNGLLLIGSPRFRECPEDPTTRQLTGTRASFGSIGGVAPLCHRWTSLAFGERSRRRQRGRAACA